MRAPEHVSIAVVTTGGLLFALNGFEFDVTAQTAAAVGVAAIGSLVPDIDHPQAWISNRIPATLVASGGGVLLSYAIANWMLGRETSQSMGSALMGPLAEMMRPLLGLAWVALASGIALLVVSIVVARTLGHRGPTHSLAINAALTVVAVIVFAITGPSWTLGLWFGFGYLTHLLADMLTPMGCPSFLWPAGEGLPRIPLPQSQPMTRPGAQEIGTPSQITSTAACSSKSSLGESKDLGASSLASGSPQTEDLEQHD